MKCLVKVHSSDYHYQEQTKAEPTVEDWGLGETIQVESAPSVPSTQVSMKGCYPRSQATLLKTEGATVKGRLCKRDSDFRVQGHCFPLLDQGTAVPMSLFTALCLGVITG